MHAPPAGEQLVRFEELFAAHHERVLAYLLRRVTNSGDVDDLVAETFLTAWRRLGDVPGGEGALPWLYAVARRVLANHRRREQTRLALVDKLRTAPVHTGHPDPEGAALTAAAWRELPERDREVLALIAWEGLEADQVAVVLGCSRNAVRIRLHRAKRRFEKLLRSTPALPEGGAA
ncbi:RNA polymerase sigma factor [Kribbella sandramycini]|uniref:RNA polymerase sigma-70 factor (ECF subfamily) n=1 Tax=Kribbella sandramycini TaxID=60450 RepID=A0A841S8M6_9ACTN|nr:RNA polymerase sigma-70 factor (ECF subfamily) [Kribbella sandramycini]